MFQLLISILQINCYAIDSHQLHEISILISHILRLQLVTLLLENPSTTQKSLAQIPFKCLNFCKESSTSHQGQDR